jgi:hypothetical protein
MGEDDAPGVTSGCPEDRHVWRVGGDRIDLASGPRGWVARVRRSAWGSDELVVDGTFADEAEALAWCARMAKVLASDLEDDQGGEGPGASPTPG